MGKPIKFATEQPNVFYKGGHMGAGGCNVESSSYGLTCCAERTALFRAISEGYKNFRSLAVSSNNGGMPCGACRQVIWDLCKNIPIHICDKNDILKTIYSSELLPDAFDDTYLK